MAEDSTALGRALRHARRERGMTQRELGAPTHSASFVSLVEAGRRRAGAETLRVFCERLGTTVQALADVAGEGAPRTRDEVALDLAWAKIAIRAGNPVSAEKYARIVLDDPTLGEHARLDALSLLAAATEGQGRVEEALEIIDDLVARLDPDRTRELWLSVEVMRMRCSLQVGDVDQAVDVGNRAMARLGRTWGDQEATLVVTLADAHRSRGDLVRARMLLTSTISRAEGSSARARGSALWNASLVAADEGRLDDAARLSEQALGALGESATTRSLARLHANCGDVLLDSDQPDAVDRARAHFEAAREGLEMEGSAIEQARLLSEVARCDLMDGDLDAAEQTVLAAEVLLHQADESADLERAFTRLLASQVLIGRGQLRRGLDEAAAAARDTERHDTAFEASRTWRTVADLARDHGDPALLLESLERVADLAGVRPTRVGRTTSHAPSAPAGTGVQT